jgi:molybdopterin molybdotransferase
MPGDAASAASPVSLRGTFLQNSVVSYREADETVRGHALGLSPGHPPQAVPLLETLGRVLAQPVIADRDQPPFPRSTRDGFACRAAEVMSGPLDIGGVLRAGQAWEEVLAPGQAVEIMTGAPVPEGADCVVMIEHVEQDGNVLRLASGRTIAAGENVVAQGAEARRGDVILHAGTRMAAPHIAAAAACGAGVLEVFPRPRVAIVSTGDELVELDQPLARQQIRNSNSYSLAAQVLAAGGEPVRLPIARDDLTTLESTIRQALDCDLLLLSGGVSMGKYDLVETVLVELGAEFYFTGALIQPGKPVVFGKLGSMYFFGLPGNPVSTMVTFLLFAETVLGALAGDLHRRPRFARARLAGEVRVKKGLTRFLPARLADLHVEVVAWQGSGDLAASSRSNCFLVVPSDSAGIGDGEMVTVLL